MKFDTNNRVIQLCSKGMILEGENKKEQAAEVFMQAWELALNDFEKFTAAHYVARHQPTVADKLKWDLLALNHAQKIGDETIKESFPSLYLNIAKCYEDLEELEKAKENYVLALSYAELLPGDGYGAMIRRGIENGLDRISAR